MHRYGPPGASQGNSPLRHGAFPRQDRYRGDPSYDYDYDHAAASAATGATRSHRAPSRARRKRWVLIPLATVAVVLATGIAAAAATGDAGIHFTVVSPVTVQALGVDVSNAAVGQTVTAGAKVVAERKSILSEVAIAVTGPDGKRADFPHVRAWSLGTSQKLFAQSRSFDQAGTYRYWFMYKRDGRWIGLNPKQTFTVGGSATATPGATTPAATPSPSGSTTPSPAGTPSGTSTSASSTPAASTNTALRGCASNPAGCGYPSTASAGVPAGTALAVINGNYTISTNGAVVDGKEIHGCVDVRAANVTIRNSRIIGPCFFGISTDNAGGTTTIDRVEVNCTDGHGNGINGPNFAAHAVYIHDCENGLEINSNSSVVDSVISAREGSTDSHGDGIQSQDGTNIVIRHNTLLEINPVTSAIITNPTLDNGWIIEDNFMGGGAYTLYCPEQGTNFVVRNNRFVAAKLGSLYSAAYGLTDACNHAGITWSGNYLDSNGSVVSP